jgi:hypothetical protein
VDSPTHVVAPIERRVSDLIEKHESPANAVIFGRFYPKNTVDIGVFIICKAQSPSSHMTENAHEPISTARR